MARREKGIERSGCPATIFFPLLSRAAVRFFLSCTVVGEDGLFAWLILLLLASLPLARGNRRKRSKNVFFSLIWRGTKKKEYNLALLEERERVHGDSP
jgi:hypothetical protein